MTTTPASCSRLSPTHDSYGHHRAEGHRGCSSPPRLGGRDYRTGRSSLLHWPRTFLGFGSRAHAAGLAPREWQRRSRRHGSLPSAESPRCAASPAPPPHGSPLRRGIRGAGCEQACLRPAAFPSNGQADPKRPKAPSGVVTQQDCKLKGVAHALAFCVHSTELERVAEAGAVSPDNGRAVVSRRSARGTRDPATG